MFVEEAISLLEPKELICDQTEERVTHDRTLKGRLLHCRAHNQVDVLDFAIQRLENVHVLKHHKIHLLII